MTEAPVYFVGAPWKGHGGHAGYEMFCDLVGTKLWRFPTRDLPGLPGKVVDRLIGRLLGRRYYTFGNFMTELYASLHLLFHPRAHYHVLYGDSDCVLLPKVLRRVPRRASVTLHLPAYRLPVGFTHELLRPFDTVVFLADVHRRLVEAELPWAQCVVIEHPVDTDYFAPAEALPGSFATSESEAGRILLSVGGHLRDFRTLAEATRRLRAADVIDRLVLVGVPATERHHFTELAASGDAELRVGVSDEELRELYQNAAVVVLALDDAYANNALLEALACGSLIVASDVGAVAEYLNDAGLLCPPHDPAQLASTIQRALSDPEQMSSLKRAARSRALELSRKQFASRFQRSVNVEKRTPTPTTTTSTPMPSTTATTSTTAMPSTTASTSTSTTAMPPAATTEPSKESSSPPPGA